MLQVPRKIVFNVSRFKPALNLKRFFGGFETWFKFIKFGFRSFKFVVIISIQATMVT